MNKKNIDDIVEQKAYGGKDVFSVVIPTSKIDKDVIRQLTTPVTAHKNKICAYDAPLKLDDTTSKPYELAEGLQLQFCNDEAYISAIVPLGESNEYTAKSLVQYANKISQGHFSDYLN